MKNPAWSYLCSLKYNSQIKDDLQSVLQMMNVTSSTLSAVLIVFRGSVGYAHP